MKESRIYDVQSFSASALNATALPATVRRAPVIATWPTLCYNRDAVNASLHLKRRKQYVLRAPPTRMKKNWNTLSGKSVVL